MMEEIKFRVWDNTSKTIGGQRMICWDEIIENDIEGLYLLRDIFDKENSLLILMQFTGLHDKNGKEIWEGDLIAMMVGFAKFEGQDREDWDWENYIGKIIFESGCFWFRGINRYGAGYADCLWFHHNQEDYEVIGNIYENPGLAEKKVEGK